MMDIKENNAQQTELAARELYDDYKNDKELTILPSSIL